MAKGQLRGNRETKKPKQAPKPSVPVTAFAIQAPRDASPIVASKKK